MTKSPTVTEAARDLIASKFETFKAGNGRQVGIQDDNGEKCWIVPFDRMLALEIALTSPPGETAQVEAVTDERSKLALLVEQLAEMERPGRSKLVLMIAARAIRRGRLLTSAEQLENVRRFITEPDDEDTALSEGGTLVGKLRAGVPIKVWDDGGAGQTVSDIHAANALMDEAADAITSSLTKEEADAVLRAAFPTVGPEDMGDHVALILDAASSLSAKESPEQLPSKARTTTEVEVADTWQDIATAPKDGTEILVFVRTDEGAEMQQVAHWDGAPTAEWPWQVSDGSAYHRDLFTHWQPLRNPPQRTP